MSWNIHKVIHFIVCWTLWLTGMFFYVRRHWIDLNHSATRVESTRLEPNRGKGNVNQATNTTTPDETVKKQTPVRTKLNRLAFYANLQLYFILIVYLPMILKYLIVMPLDSEQFHEYRYLDCFLFGRFYFYGRTDRANKYIAVMGVSCALIYRLFFAKIIKNEFKYQALEFLFRGHKEVVLNEVRFGQYRQAQDGYLLLAHFNRRRQNKTEPLYLIEDSKYAYGHSGRFYARPCRSSYCWLRLAKFMTTTFVIYTTIVTTWTLILYYIHTPAVITKLGFELSYPNCIEWISRQAKPADYKFILDIDRNHTNYIRTAKKLPFVLPYRDFIEFNSFHLVRISFEIFDNHLIAWDMLYSFSVHGSVVYVIAYDLYLNKQHIAEQLVAFIGQIVREKHGANSKRTPQAGQIKSTRINLKNDTTNSRTMELQAILMDHFSLVSKYNHYVSFHCRFIICIWVAYTSIVCVWISMVDDQSLKVELTVGEMLVIGLVFGNLIGASFVKFNNHKLYNLIGTIMALDDNCTTKMRWTTILQYYYPKPLYCISLFSTIEVSFLFCLKVS